MLRRIAPILLIAALAAPAGLDAQGARRDDGRSSRGEAAEDQQVFWGVFQAIRDYALNPTADSTLWRRAIEGMLESLDDPYAAVLSPRAVNEFQEETTGDYAGIGVQITQLNDEITVTAVFRKTPAEMSGIQVGDVIVGVDGASTQGWTTGDASDKIRGPVGTVVEVEIRRPGIAEPLNHPIRRDQVHISSVTADYITESVGYIGLDRVARRSASEVDSAFTVLSGAQGIIVDLRRNPGGYLDEALNLADLFLERGELIASTRSRRPGRASGSQEESGFARMPARIPEKSIIVLVDRFTASAAEILAGALQDHDRALVIGERTFGKGVVQTILPLQNGWQVKLTTGEWYTPLGRSLHRPRDPQGRPLAEPDSIPTYVSDNGRHLRGGGGVFPDVEVQDDTLKTAERDLLNAVGQAEFPFALRLAELAFGAAQEAKAGRGPATLSESLVDDLSREIAAGGVESRLVQDPVARDYLRWRLEVALAQRLNDDGRVLRARLERDPVLAEAVKLLQTSGSQGDLFRIAAARAAGTRGAPGS